jgi:hypothetical protein
LEPNVRRRLGETEMPSLGSLRVASSPVYPCPLTLQNSGVKQYIVYDGESRDVHFEGECTNTLKDGILARQTGPDGPVLMKCLSASPNPTSRRFDLLRSSATVSNCDVVVGHHGTWPILLVVLFLSSCPHFHLVDE